jgi:hypothetical protein
MKSQLLQIAIDDNTSGEQLRELAKMHINFAQISTENLNIVALGQTIAKNPNTPPDILIRLFWNFPIEVLNNPVLKFLLLENPNLLYEFFQVNPKIFSKQNLPNFFIEWAIIHPDTNIRSAFIVDSPYICQECLEEFSNDSSSFIRSLIAEKEKTPTHILLKLAEDKYAEVRVAVAKNSNSSANALELLANDKIHRIRELVAGHKNTSIYILEKLANNKYEDVRLAVAKNPNTPKYLQEKLANDKCEKIRTIVGVVSPHPSPFQNP